MEQSNTLKVDLIESDTSKMSAQKRLRRSHASRRAESRRRIVKAAIRCLNKFGYGGTTIDTILAEADVSRGRLLNVFPTKTEIMVAVGTYVWELDSRYYRLWAHDKEIGPDLLDEMIEMFWNVFSRPSGIAVLEILVASRSDSQLADKFVPKHRQVQAESLRLTIQFLDAVGLAKKIDAKAFHDFVEACFRGLVIDRAFGENTDQPPKALELLKGQLRQMIALAEGG